MTGPAVYLKEALGEFRRLQDTDGIAATLKGLTLLALARGDRQEADLNGNLLLGLYQTRGQEQEARELEALLKAAEVREVQGGQCPPFQPSSAQCAPYGIRRERCHQSTKFFGRNMAGSARPICNWHHKIHSGR